MVAILDTVVIILKPIKNENKKQSYIKIREMSTTKNVYNFNCLQLSFMYYIREYNEYKCRTILQVYVN